MNNLNNQVWVFLQDDQFIKWVYSPDEDVNAYWDNWMKENPSLLTSLLKAREIARDLAYAESPPDAERISEAIWSGMQGKLQEKTNLPQPISYLPIPESSRYKRTFWYWAAAALTGLIILGAVAYYHRSGPALSAEQGVSSQIVNENLLRVNRTDINQAVYLVDGSKVILQPGAAIRHAVFLQKDKREIDLEGNAFFEVAKDAARPFYVYTKDVVVRVLGTRFYVTTDKAKGDVTVLVRAGRVSVFKKTNPLHGQLILTTNQKALYKAQTQDLIQSVPDHQDLSPVPDNSAPGVNFSFEEMPVIKIFKTLESAYGIQLHYDEKTFSGCVITTSLTDETFEEKLRIICEAIGAKYRIDNNGVFIEGRPCRQ